MKVAQVYSLLAEQTDISDSNLTPTLVIRTQTYRFSTEW